MPYLDPSRVLDEFSTFTIAEIRPALPDEKPFLRGQVGSMASTLRFLARELEGLEGAVADQRASLLDALETSRTRVDDERTAERLHELHETVASAQGETRSVEETLLEAADEALAAVDDLDESAAREARAPIYDFLDDRIAVQLDLLRGAESSD